MKAISVTDDFFQEIDLATKENEIMSFLSKELNFLPQNIPWRSRYWGKGTGAFLINGLYQGKKAIAKIQGAKPTISEVIMIKEFEKQNQSKIIRPPKVYHFLPWSSKRGYEVIIMEKIEGEYIVNSGQKATSHQIKEFFSLYDEYKDKCLNQPWLPPPKKISYYQNYFSKWKKIRKTLDKDKIINKKDEKILERVAFYLDKNFSRTNLEFSHNHLSVYDFKKISPKEVIVFSNLFWGWRWPLYDLVFGYQWFILSLSHLPEKEIWDQISLWQTAMKETKEAKNKPQLYNLALLERTLAAYNLDVLMIPDEENRKKMKKILWTMLKQF